MVAVESHVDGMNVGELLKAVVVMVARERVDLKFLTTLESSGCQLYTFSLELHS